MRYPVVVVVVVVVVVKSLIIYLDLVQGTP